MSTTQPYNDTPNQIKVEGQRIDLKFVKTSDNTATISWNIPEPAVGCDVNSQAYNGFLVTLDTVASTLDSAPVNGTYYTGDPTASVGLHAGDKIGTALVISALYDDKKTIELQVSDLSANTPYYVSGYAVDAQGRYHKQGVHAYSQELSGYVRPELPAYQIIQLGFVDESDGFDIALLGQGFSTGVHAEKLTELDPNTDYVFYLKIDQFEVNDCDPDWVGHEITISGADAQTYAELCTAIEVQIALLTNPPQSAGRPNVGCLYLDVPNEKLYSWDGDTHIEQPLIIDDENPVTSVVDGDYWIDVTDNTLYQWYNNSWNSVNFFRYHKDPTGNLDSSDFWFNGTNGYRFEGNVWCEKATYNQTTSPSLAPTLLGGTYWYDENTGLLNRWSTDCTKWVAIDTIYTETDPDGITAGDYWYNTETKTLSIRSASPLSWVEYPERFEASETQPTLPALDTAWLDLTTNELKIYDGSTFNVTPYVAYHLDPTNRETCQLWWDSNDDILYVWDIVSSQWNQVVSFIQSSIDPSKKPTIEVGSLWYNPTEISLARFDGSEWVAVTFINYINDPTSPTLGTYWNDTTDNNWNGWIVSPEGWDLLNPYIHDSAPNSITAGTYWYNPTAPTLSMWTGVAMIAVAFQTNPCNPTKGYVYFDTSGSPPINQLYEWNGTAWVDGTLLATCRLTECGNMVITSSTTGSLSCIYTSDGDLFKSLSEVVNFKTPYQGRDEISSEPSYLQVGVGTDGSSDERRHMIEQIQKRMGHPGVKIELSKEQYDTCIRLALDEFRNKSASAYKRVFFFMDAEGNNQHYEMSNKRIGYNKITEVLAAYRFQSSFLGHAAGQGAYGQAMLQHLYQMGSFDLVSYHIVSDYVELMNVMFAAYLVFTWDEENRMLRFHQTFGHNERILLDCMMERTEQELMKNRTTKVWIERFALGQAQLMLSEVRGKYQSLPGAGGGVSLNAQDLQIKGEANIEKCMEEIDNFVANEIEEVGMGGDFLLG